MELKGQPEPLAEKVMQERTSGGTFLPISASTDMVAFPRVNPSVSQLTWFDRQGKLLGTVGEPTTSSGLLRLSPDGTQLAWTNRSGGTDATSIWLLDISRGGTGDRFTFGSPIDNNPVWAPDGSRIIFSSNRTGTLNLYEKSVTGAKGEYLLFKSSEDIVATSWSRDGRFLLCNVLQPKTKEDIWVFPLDNVKKPLLFLSTEFTERGARFSPEGHWVAYSSDVSGKAEVYIRSISINSAGTAVEAGRQWRISSGGGSEPRWRGDGQELYFRAPDGSLLAVEITTSPVFRASSPKPIGSFRASSWDATMDGKRFLASVTTGGAPTYTVELNWQAGLKKQP